MATKRNLFFIFFSVLGLLIFYSPLRELVRLALYQRLYAHMILVPFVSAYFIFLKRKEIALQTHFSFKTGILLLLIGFLLFWVEKKSGLGLSQSSHLSFAVLSAYLFWIGGFILFYGVRAFKIAAFPLLFLLFMIPIPDKALGMIITLLTSGSAEATHVFFKLTGVPHLREGFSFILPELSIEVAEQCSGINSGVALFVASIVAAQLFLRTGWKKMVFALASIPITILKNGMRIATLTLLGIYVDPKILSSDLHRQGGIPFFLVAIAMMAPILWYLRRSDKRNVRTEDQGLRRQGNHKPRNKD